jgi:ABC-type multidrug transport system ATPase subunit
MENVQAAIEARAVGLRTSSGQTAIRDISLTVAPGELVAITSGAGPGRTALLGALSGRLEPTSGTVARGPREQGQPASGSGYVTDDDLTYRVLPLARALRYSAGLRAVRDPDRAVAGALAEAGLASRAGVAFGRLDPGERRRAAVAAALLSRPSLLFLDEPTAGLGPAPAAELLRLLRRVAGSGVTVVLTTGSPLDVARCDKVAVLATGGDLAFFGLPEEAQGYFGADSLEEIYQRLAGLGDPAEAWSRRFFQLSRARPGSVPVPAAPQAAPAGLMADVAGPLSAGRPEPAGARALDGPPRAAEPGPAVTVVPAARPPGLVALLPVLIRRDAEVLARDRRTQGVLAGLPVLAALVCCLLLAAGALDGPVAVTLAWVVLGGLAAGLAYQLTDRSTERGLLRGERVSGLRPVAFILAKTAVLLPLLALADALILAVPEIAGRLRDGFGPAYLAAGCASLAGLACAFTVTVWPARR